MDSVLIIGVEGVVGANLAAVISATRPVQGVARQSGLSPFTACDLLPWGAATSCRDLVQRRRPQRIVYCGSGAESGWAGVAPRNEEVEDLAAWLAAAGDVGAGFTLISSDAVFTGPWMFHAENSHSLCRSPEATLLRRLEEMVLTTRPDALVLRTHAFGWSPRGGRELSQLDAILSAMGLPPAQTWDGTRHASPLLATDLAEVLTAAWKAGLAGVYHVAGAERVNPLQFAQRLAHEFGVGCAPPATRNALIDPALGFGLGETSLQTRKVRRALGLSLPMLGEGLRRLHEQAVNGMRDRLIGQSAAQRAA